MSTLMIRAIQGGLAVLPFPLTVSLVERVARGYVRLASRVPSLPGSRRFRRRLQEIVSLTGREPDATQRCWLLENPHIFTLLSIVDEKFPFDLGRAERSPMEIRGRGHLETALAEGRGAILLTGHFGFPPSVRALLQSLDVRVVGVRLAGGREADVSVGRDVWARARALRQLEDALGRDHVCIVLADGGSGTRTSVPFLGRDLSLGLGAFALARRTRAPLLPFFALKPPGRGFRIDVLPAIAVSAEDDGVVRAAAEFARLYAQYVSRYPCHLQSSSPGLALAPRSSR